MDRFFSDDFRDGFWSLIFCLAMGGEWALVAFGIMFGADGGAEFHHCLVVIARICGVKEVLGLF